MKLLLTALVLSAALMSADSLSSPYEMTHPTIDTLDQLNFSDPTCPSPCLGGSTIGWNIGGGAILRGGITSTDGTPSSYGYWIEDSPGGGSRGRVGAHDSTVQIDFAHPQDEAAIYVQGAYGTDDQEFESVKVLGLHGEVLDSAYPQALQPTSLKPDPASGGFFLGWSFKDDEITALQISGGQFGTTFDNVEFSEAPEPLSIALAGMGLVFVAAYSRRRKRAGV